MRARRGASAQDTGLRMSVARQITPHLPHLRRFARALTGAQEAGDSLVIATLETLIDDDSLFRPDLPPKAALYNVFIDVLRVGDGEGEWSAKSTSPAERKLRAMTPKARQAFLLNAMEGFRGEEIAAILSCAEADVADLIVRAEREIASEMATSVLIIEDEPIIALDIETLVAELGHRVSGVARTHREAIEAMKVAKAGLVLADIQLADGSSGLDAVNEILRTVDLPVIFITAYPERLLTGERPEPAFLITKPFQPEEVKAVISQALFFDQRSARAPA